jgi:hypothetical protein
VLILLLCFATYRVTRLITRDSMPLVAGPVGRLETWVHKRYGARWAEGLRCPWCVSVWIGGVLTAATAVTVGLPVPWLVWPVVSAAAGLLDCIEDRLAK